MDKLCIDTAANNAFHRKMKCFLAVALMNISKGVYYSLAVRRIRSYFVCRIQLLQVYQCGIWFLYFYAVAENSNVNEQFTVFRLCLFVFNLF